MGKMCLIRGNAESAMWEPIQVPVYTCLLFVDDPGDYRCIVCEEIYYFIVMWKGMIMMFIIGENSLFHQGQQP